VGGKHRRPAASNTATVTATVPMRTITTEAGDLQVTLAQAYTLKGTHMLGARVRENGDVAVITYDADAANPRDWYEPLATFTGLDRYLPDEVGAAHADNPIDVIIERHGADARLIPIYVHDHGGVAYRTGEPIGVDGQVPAGRRESGSGWDTSMAGFAIVDADTVARTYGDDSPESWDKAITVAREEVNEYAAWVNGDVYKVDVFDHDGERIDTWCGLSRFEDAETCAASEPGGDW